MFTQHKILISSAAKTLLYTALFFFSCLTVSCKKDFLDAKPNKSLIIPSTVQDYQSLLDNSSVFNSYDYPYSTGEVASDNYYVTYSSYQAQSNTEQVLYVWGDNPFSGKSIDASWSLPFQEILNANVILEGIAKVLPNGINGSQSDWNNVKGSALFFRSFCFYELSQLFCKQYNATTANTDLGLPLRLSSDLNIKSTRATLQQTYDQVLNDLKTAAPLLPVTPLYKTRPSKPAVYGLLARIYLSMGNYAAAGSYADSCLQANNQLMDFNTLPSASANPNPIPIFNPEVVFHSDANPYSIDYFNTGIVDSTLYSSFNNNDLRKTVYFRNLNGAERMFACYGGSFTQFFDGIATDEMYLIKAECEARNNDVTDAMNDLNTLLKSRWATGTFVPYTASSSADALKQILQERRKELIARGLRYSDLRRLNQDPNYAITLTRILNGQTYTLAPNSPYYVLPIPDAEIQLSGIQQNPR